MEKKEKLCYFCLTNTGKYTCPRCNSLFCSQLCYQSENHSHCSEQFYKECVEEELKLKNFDIKQKTQLLEIFNKYRGDVEADETQMLEIFNKYRDDVEADEGDSDDEDSIPELSDRLQNIDLNDADKIWDCLTEQEKLEFNAFMNSGEINHLIPEYKPWWNTRYEKKIEEIETIHAENKKYKEICPTVELITPFRNLSKIEPSACILWNIVNVLGAYAFTVRRYIGEHHNSSAANTIIYLSTNLNCNQNFDSKKTAIVSIIFHANNKADITCSEEESATLHEDIEKLLAGPENCEIEFYVLSALSDLQRLLSNSLSRKKNERKKTDFSKKYSVPVEIVDKKKVRSSIQKLTFYMSWVTEFYKKYKT